MQINILNIYQRHKKNIAILALILFLGLAYFLSLNARQRIREDAQYWKKNSLLVQNLLSRGNSQQDIINILEKKYRQWHHATTLQQDQGMPGLVKDYAQRMNIRVADIKSHPEAIFINFCPMQTSVVQMQAEAGYINLLKYLEVLKQVCGEAVSVERLKAKKDKINPDKLKLMLELRFYSRSLR